MRDVPTRAAIEHEALKKVVAHAAELQGLYIGDMTAHPLATEPAGACFTEPYIQAVYYQEQSRRQPSIICGHSTLASARLCALQPLLEPIPLSGPLPGLEDHCALDQAAAAPFHCAYDGLSCCQWSQWLHS